MAAHFSLAKIESGRESSRRWNFLWAESLPLRPIRFDFPLLHRDEFRATACEQGYGRDPDRFSALEAAIAELRFGAPWTSDFLTPPGMISAMAGYFMSANSSAYGDRFLLTAIESRYVFRVFVSCRWHPFEVERLPPAA